MLAPLFRLPARQQGAVAVCPDWAAELSSFTAVKGSMGRLYNCSLPSENLGTDL